MEASHKWIALLWLGAARRALRSSPVQTNHTVVPLIHCNQSIGFQVNTWLKLGCHSFPSLQQPLNDRHVYRGEMFLVSEYITENSIKPYVPGELGTIKHTKHQNLNCKNYWNKGIGTLQLMSSQLSLLIEWKAQIWKWHSRCLQYYLKYFVIAWQVFTVSLYSFSTILWLLQD